MQNFVHLLSPYECQLNSKTLPQWSNSPRTFCATKPTRQGKTRQQSKVTNVSTPVDVLVALGLFEVDVLGVSELGVRQLDDAARGTPLWRERCPSSDAGVDDVTAVT